MYPCIHTIPSMFVLELVSLFHCGVKVFGAG